MARPLLSLYAIDGAALEAVEGELRAVLADDDRAAAAKLLGLGDTLALRLAARPTVEWFLRSDDDAEAAPFFASLRRIAKKRALARVWSSTHPSLEGRLRGYDVLRDEKPVADAIDRALDAAAVPFFLTRKGATAGLLSEKDRTTLVEAIGPGGGLRATGEGALPDELAEFGDALAELDGELLLHDALD